MRTYIVSLIAAIALFINATTALAGTERAQVDADLDGIVNGRDNCVMLANPWQLDSDRDGVGDSCDPDRDGDGIVNILDNCPLIANGKQSDGNRDGVGDRCDATTTEIALGE